MKFLKNKIVIGLVALCMICTFVGCKKEGEVLDNVITTVIDTSGEAPIITGANYKLGDTYEYVSSSIINSGLSYELNEKETILVKYGTNYPNLDGTVTVLYTFKNNALYEVLLNVYGTDKEAMQEYVKDAKHYCVASDFEYVEADELYKDVAGNMVKISSVGIAYEENMYNYSMLIKAKRIYS